MSPQDAIADQKKRDYLDSLKMKMETRVGRQLEDEFNTKTPPDGVSTNASSPEPRRNPRNPYGNHADRLRNQRENIGRNIPGQQRRPNIERELFDDFKVGLGLEKAEKTDLIQSPEAKFRRNQIKKCMREGKEVPGFDELNA